MSPNGSVNKYKHKILKHLATRCLAGLLVKTLLSQAIFVASIVHLKFYVNCRNWLSFIVNNLRTDT